MASLTVRKSEGIRQWATLIRHFLHVDPTDYDDATFAARVNEVKWLIKVKYPNKPKGQ